LARGGEVIDVRPGGGSGRIFIVAQMERLSEPGADFLGDQKCAIGLLIADGAHKADFVGDGQEAFQTTRDVFLDVANDHAKADFHSSRREGSMGIKRPWPRHTKSRRLGSSKT